ncbi:ATP-binding protein [Chthoniobacter flavus]|uniref:ATP-binding protein n=1 Tax=Chthoniobacter flavus TaxID=191863 RepID=UPI001404F47A|nr:ATP-binding protein [Chthoniobacter flavus]
MSILASTIHRGPLVRAQKTVIYGPEGIGKTTLAAQFPSPVFLDTEGGTHHLDVARFPAPKTWDDVTKTIAALASEPHEFRTLVVDTADWLEKLLIEDVCRRANKTSIEEFGYGKGYVVLAEEVTKFLASLNALLARGMHVLLLAHCRIAKFEQPDAAGAYDRYELKLTKQVAPLVKEWCDMLLFANYFTKIAENDSGKKRGVGGRERKLYTTHTAAWDAKNRHGFEENLPFEFAAVASAFGASTEIKPVAPVANPVERLAELVSGKEDVVNAFLVARQQIKTGQTWRDVAPDYALRVISKPDDFLRAVEAQLANGGAK